MNDDFTFTTRYDKTAYQALSQASWQMFRKPRLQSQAYPILAALSSLFTGGSLSPLLQAILMPYTLLMPPYLSGWLTWEYQLWCWGIGLGWGGVSTIVGLLWFFRRDIR